MTRPSMAARPVFVAAALGDAHPVADLIATAFHPLDVAAWLVPDPDDRLRALYADFRILVEHAIVHGTVLSTGDGRGVAVWLPHDRDMPVPGIADYDRRLWLACGPYTDRFAALDTAFAARYPTTPHHHLVCLAVHPDIQSRGVGSGLLDWYHRRLDQARLPAYLEASSRQSRALYLRHGYVDLGAAIELPGGGPRLWPMWRSVRRASATASKVLPGRGVHANPGS
jgi:GNAT superfamily N-acetyltransferase